MKQRRLRQVIPVVEYKIDIDSSYFVIDGKQKRLRQVRSGMQSVHRKINGGLFHLFRLVEDGRCVFLNPSPPIGKSYHHLSSSTVSKFPIATRGNIFPIG